MKLSKLIKNLQRIQDKYGDIETLSAVMDDTQDRMINHNLYSPLIKFKLMSDLQLFHFGKTSPSTLYIKGIDKKYKSRKLDKKYIKLDDIKKAVIKTNNDAIIKFLELRWNNQDIDTNLKEKSLILELQNFISKLQY